MHFNFNEIILFFLLLTSDQISFKNSEFAVVVSCAFLCDKGFNKLLKKSPILKDDDDAVVVGFRGNGMFLVSAIRLMSALSRE